MSNPFKDFKKTDWILWIISLAVVIISNLLIDNGTKLIFFAVIIGVTSLIFAAKGNAWAQILMVAFSIMYGIVSYTFRYWGEMITYLGMCMPMAIWSFITWVMHPSKENKGEVEISILSKKDSIYLSIATLIVTALFYGILCKLNTPNILMSTVSITTSFAAAALTMMRSSYYALAYAMNDIILIVLWVLASLENSMYVPIVVNFSVFLVNDLYGFISWKQRENKKIRKDKIRKEVSIKK